MIIACRDEGWIMEAVRAEIVQMPMTDGTVRQALRMKSIDGGSRRWLLPDGWTPNRVIQDLMVNSTAGIVTSLPKGRSWTDSEADEASERWQ